MTEIYGIWDCNWLQPSERVDINARGGVARQRIGQRGAEQRRIVDAAAAGCVLPYSSRRHTLPTTERFSATQFLRRGIGHEVVYAMICSVCDITILSGTLNFRQLVAIFRAPGKVRRGRPPSCNPGWRSWHSASGRILMAVCRDRCEADIDMVDFGNHIGTQHGTRFLYRDLTLIPISPVPIL
jgi:hypothetical protein